MPRISNGGKGDKRRNENTAAVEANWPTNWNSRGLPEVHEDAQEHGPADGTGDVQAPDAHVPTGSE